MVSHRELGEHRFQYADYKIKVTGKWVDHNYSHEKTPRYEVTAYAKRIDGGACENFMATTAAPVESEPNFFGKLLGEEPTKNDLSDLVEASCNRVRGEIDGMYEDIGMNQAEEEFQARAEAEAAVESWVNV